MSEKRYRYEIEYLVTSETEGRHKRKREVEFTKAYEDWKHSDVDMLARYLTNQEKTRCEIAIIDIRLAKE